MGYWQVGLKGKESHLRRISNQWTSTENSISKVNEVWYLKSMQFDKLTSATDVQNSATSILDKLNDVFFFLHNLGPIKIDNIVKVDNNGTLHNYLLLNSDISLGNYKITLSPSVSLHTETPKILNPVSTLYNIAIANKPVSDALHFYRKNNWVNLFKVYEIIKDDIGDIKKKNYDGISNKEISRFTGTAQSRSALGDDARHAAKRYFMKNPMELDEAKKLIKNIIDKWLLSKA